MKVFVLCLDYGSVTVNQAAVLTTSRGYALACRQPHSVLHQQSQWQFPSTFGLLTAPLLLGVKFPAEPANFGFKEINELQANGNPFTTTETEI